MFYFEYRKNLTFLIRFSLPVFEHVEEGKGYKSKNRKKILVANNYQLRKTSTMKRINIGLFLIASVSLLIVFNGCKSDIYKGIHQVSWEKSIEDAPRWYFLIYLKEEPSITDTFPGDFPCPRDYQPYQNSKQYKWVKLSIRIVDVQVNKIEYDRLKNSKIFTSNSGPYPFRSIKNVIYPVCSNKLKRNILNAYSKAELLYLLGGTMLDGDNDRHYDVILTETIQKEDHKYSSRLLPFPKNTDLD